MNKTNSQASIDKTFTNEPVLSNHVHFDAPASAPPTTESPEPVFSSSSKLSRRPSSASSSSTYDASLKLTPLIPIFILIATILTFMFMHSGMTLGDILDELTSLSPFLGGILVALTYSPLMILFFPKSVLGGITGFIFKLPNGIFVELLGTFLGIASVLLVGRNVLGPIIYMDWSKKLRRRSVAHTVGSIAEVNEERPLVSSGQNIAGYTTTASGDKPRESFLRQKIPAWVKSFRKKLRVGRKLYEKQGGWRLVFLLAFSPAVPVHITTYLVSIIGVPFHISLWTIFMCNIPYSCIYVFIGASAKNLSDIITGGGDDENLWWKIPLMLISIITIALIAFFVVKYGGQMVAEVDKEDDDAAEAELLGEEGSTEEEFDSFNEDDEEVDLNDSRV